MSKHASKVQSWDELFGLSSQQLKERGLEPTRDRRYLLRWREKFRKGDYGIGGDFQHVKDGVAELRVVEVPSLKPPPPDAMPTATYMPGMQKLIVNVPNGSATYELDSGETTADLKKPQGYKLLNGHIISGQNALPMKGTNWSGVTVKATEGMWEHKRGVKKYGGERRRTETLHKLRVEQNKKSKR